MKTTSPVRRTHHFVTLALSLALGAFPFPIARPEGRDFSQGAAQVPVTAPPADLDAYVQRVMRTFEVPGVAVTIVKDGRPIVAKGYGVRRLGEPAPVDARTLFGIASNTKLFTATALGLLVEEGKIEWDAPVVRYLPGFQMWDPFVTRELTIRDLLVHRSGLAEEGRDDREQRAPLRRSGGRQRRHPARRH